ncbi:MAG: hypothetical protein Pg6C_06570 [Treponemataceae bacterium]|nr:MAG: hypothetical protein Pg6C_06570 [Treponemataceae bacterium]
MLIERIFGKIKENRRIAARYDKLDIMFSGYIYLALVFIAVISLLSRCVNKP